MKLNLYCDGGARGNPGPAAVGVYIVDDKGNGFAQIARLIGKTTNNVAEYRAVVEALNWVKEFTTSERPEIERITLFLDSTLVVNQLNGVFKVKNKNLRELLLKVRILENEINHPIYYQHIPRRGNLKADKLVNSALDSQRSSSRIVKVVS